VTLSSRRKRVFLEGNSRGSGDPSKRDELSQRLFSWPRGGHQQTLKGAGVGYVVNGKEALARGKKDAYHGRKAAQLRDRPGARRGIKNNVFVLLS